MPKEINIPYGLNMGLCSTEFSMYDDDETKNITFPRGLRMVTEGSYLRVWKPGTAVGTDTSKDQIQINYNFRTLAALNCLVFYKPNDTIGSDNNSPNMIKMPWSLTLKTDNTHLTIYEPGDSTEGVKLEWQTLYLVLILNPHHTSIKNLFSFVKKCSVTKKLIMSN
jgi:hypothetical protein